MIPKKFKKVCAFLAEMLFWKNFLLYSGAATCSPTLSIPCQVKPPGLRCKRSGEKYLLVKLKLNDYAPRRTRLNAASHREKPCTSLPPH